MKCGKVSAKGVGVYKAREGSNPSFCAKRISPIRWMGDILLVYGGYDLRAPIGREGIAGSRRRGRMQGARNFRSGRKMQG